MSAIGTDPGFQIAHTYLGSLLTIVGACAAGIAFAAILVMRRKPAAPASDRLTGTPCDSSSASSPR